MRSLALTVLLAGCVQPADSGARETLTHYLAEIRPEDRKMTQADALTLKKGDRIKWRGTVVIVESVGRMGNGVTVWREDSQIPGRLYSDRVRSDEVTR